MRKRAISLLAAILLAITLTTGVSAAQTAEGARQFYAGYDLRVYDQVKPAVSFGSVIHAGYYECQVFYAADGYVIGVIMGNWPAIPWQNQIDNFNAYRGVEQVKGFFPERTYLPEECGIQLHPDIPAQNGPYQLEYNPYAGTGSVDTAYEVEQAIRITNEERASRGLHELEVDEALMAYAAVRAEEISWPDQFSHTRPDGTRAVSHTGVSGENIHVGTPTGALAMESWMNSKGHRENILRQRFTKIGLACYQDEVGTCWWVTVFG